MHLRTKNLLPKFFCETRLKRCAEVYSEKLYTHLPQKAPPETDFRPPDEENPDKILAGFIRRNDR